MAAVNEITIGSDWAIYRRISNGDTEYCRGVVQHSTVKKDSYHSKRGTRYFRVRFDDGDTAEYTKESFITRWESYAETAKRQQEQRELRKKILAVLEDLPFKTSVTITSSAEAIISLEGLNDLVRPVVAEHIPVVFRINVGTVRLVLESDAIQDLLQLPQLKLLSLAKELATDWD